MLFRNSYASHYLHVNQHQIPFELFFTVTHLKRVRQFLILTLRYLHSSYYDNIIVCVFFAATSKIARRLPVLRKLSRSNRWCQLQHVFQTYCVYV